MLLPSKSTVKYGLASHPHPILQYQSLSVSGHRGRVWRLKTAMCEPVWKFTIANEIAEHIIRDDFHTWARSFIPCDRHSGSSFSQARGKLEYDLKAWQHWAEVNFMKSLFTTYKQGHSFWICLRYGMEIGDALQDYEKWQNSIIFTIDSVWEKLNPQHVDITQLLKVLRSDWCHQNFLCRPHKHVTKCSFSPCVLHMQISTCLLNL